MSQPNIILLHCHDLGRFLGCYGIPPDRTPNLDRLAGQGVRFTNAFAPSSSLRPRSDIVFPVNPIFQSRTLMEVYDLAADPWEHRNLAQDAPMQDTAGQLLARMSEIMHNADDPILDGPIPSAMHFQALAALRDAVGA